MRAQARINHQGSPAKYLFYFLQGVIDIQGIISVSHIYIILVNMNNNKYNVYKNVYKKFASNQAARYKIAHLLYGILGNSSIRICSF